jgi:hypothetical protein
MPPTARALARLSRAISRAHTARSAEHVPALGGLGSRPYSHPRPESLWGGAQTRFESSNAAARARQLEHEQVRAAGAALDTMKPHAETNAGPVDQNTPSGMLFARAPSSLSTGASFATSRATDARFPTTQNVSDFSGGRMTATTDASRASSSASDDARESFRYPSSVVYVDTLEMVRTFERAGLESRIAEAVAREISGAARDATGPLASRAEFEKLQIAITAKVASVESEMKSRQREAESSSRHAVDTVTSEIEKLRSELRFAHDKITTSQKLDLNLERGRLRDDLRRQDDKTGAMELRLDREISSMKTTIEAAKNDVIKYSIGALMSMAAVGMSLMRLLS